MLKFTVKRILQAIPMLLAVSIVIFALIQAMPGDPLEMYLENPNASPEAIERIKEAHGLNDPVHIQYLHWLRGVLTGDWGVSIMTRRPVIGLIGTTTKSPKSLGLDPAKFHEPVVVFSGTTREACAAFPRNMNVHAAVALAGIGFDRTRSRIVADPSVSTNAHVISVTGEGIEFELRISSFTTGGVTGIYTPLSACGSLDRVRGGAAGLAFV